ncbi:MAG: ThiF family adenylyltransferase, partial [Anaeroplasmataceae bacterium]|nr:ThiF family adenylyltransferase [Anaeroplasmataceae bacterium]
MQTRSIPLLGEKTIDVYAQTHIAVFGLGGVGGYVVEALARSGIGMFTLFDFDKIAPSNKNRQIIALDSTVGKWKCEVMKERILDINPAVHVEYHLDKVDEEFLDKIDFHSFDYVIDCIDDIKGKLAIITKAKMAGIHLISSCGTGNKLDSTQFKIADISKTSVCPLAKKMRIELKKRDIHGVDVLYSLEEPHVQADFIPSVSFVPSVAGLLIARHVLLKLRELVLASRVHLVLEGGGMKGVYTDGVLDCFLDHNIEFDAIYGVSAGACAATSLVSKQRKRAYHAMVDYLGNPEYASKRSLLKTGNYFNKEFVYYKI